MKITELASLILENCKNPHNRNLKYIKGLINEQLHLRSYTKLLKEVDEDEEKLLNPEEEPGPDNEPEVVLAEPEEKGIEKGLEPSDLVTPDEVDQETEAEPEATVDNTPEEPTSIPTKANISNEPAAQIKPGTDSKITTISAEQARELLSYKGKIGTAVFKKKDGTRRAMNFMTGVRKFTSGGQLPYSPRDKDVIPVYDLKIGNGPKGYRMLNLPGLESLKINGKQYRVDQTLKDTEPIKEIKVNNPTKTWDDVLKLVGEIHKELGRNPRFKETKRIARQLGWKENGQDITTYINSNPKLISKFYNELLKLKKPIQEIKINNPTKTFPIKVNNEEEMKKNLDYFKDNGYTLLKYLPRMRKQNIPMKYYKYLFQKFPQYIEDESSEEGKCIGVSSFKPSSHKKI